MKIDRFYNQKEKKWQYRTRFQINKKEFYPVADTKAKLNQIIAEIRTQEHRAKYDLTTPKVYPTVKGLFDKYLVKIKKDKQKTLFKRVSDRFLQLIPEDLKVTELKKAYFQSYIDARLQDVNKINNKSILPETINKELSALSAAIKEAQLMFAELEDVQLVIVPKNKTIKHRRERLVNKESELGLLLAELRKDHSHKMVDRARKDLADDLEIKYETGLRRIEVAILQKSQYYPKQFCLRNVKRCKTNTITKYFPLTKRAVEIIESRINTNPDPFIFSKNGKPSASSYRTLKNVCEQLGIKYGTFTDGGFVPHDLRHNFATEIIQVTDIETAKSLTGHTGDHIMTYLHTNEKLQREAMNRREGFELELELAALYTGIKDDKLDLNSFIEKVKNLIPK